MHREFATSTQHLFGSGYAGLGDTVTDAERFSDAGVPASETIFEASILEREERATF
jgi:hypothetical protein